MDPELQKSLADLLAYVKQGADFAMAQAPALAHEIVSWHLWSHVVMGLACLITIVPTLMLARWGYRKSDEGGVIFGLVGLILSSVFAVLNAYEATFAAVAPRLVIIEYLTTHIK